MWQLRETGGTPSAPVCRVRHRDPQPSEGRGPYLLHPLLARSAPPPSRHPPARRRPHVTVGRRGCRGPRIAGSISIGDRTVAARAGLRRARRRLVPPPGARVGSIRPHVHGTRREPQGAAAPAVRGMPRGSPPVRRHRRRTRLQTLLPGCPEGNVRQLRPDPHDLSSPAGRNTPVPMVLQVGARSARRVRILPAASRGGRVHRRRAAVHVLPPRTGRRSLHQMRAGRSVPVRGDESCSVRRLPTHTARLQPLWCRQTRAYPRRRRQPAMRFLQRTPDSGVHDLRQIDGSRRTRRRAAVVWHVLQEAPGELRRLCPLRCPPEDPAHRAVRRVHDP